MGHFQDGYITLNPRDSDLFVMPKKELPKAQLKLGESQYEQSISSLQTPLADRRKLNFRAHVEDVKVLRVKDGQLYYLTYMLNGSARNVTKDVHDLLTFFDNLRPFKFNSLDFTTLDTMLAELEQRQGIDYRTLVSSRHIIQQFLEQVSLSAEANSILQLYLTEPVKKQFAAKLQHLLIRRQETEGDLMRNDTQSSIDSFRSIDHQEEVPLRDSTTRIEKSIMQDHFTNIKVTADDDQNEFVITLARPDHAQQQITFYKSKEDITQLLTSLVKINNTNNQIQKYPQNSALQESGRLFLTFHNQPIGVTYLEQCLKNLIN